MLVALTGLPGTGKSMLADALGIALPATVVSVDPVEAALWRAGIHRSEPTGLAAYSVAAAVTESQLRLGHSVVVDAVNAAAPARQVWEMLARGYQVALRVIEVTCSDEALHRRRLAKRTRSAEEPAVTWSDVELLRAEYRSWQADGLLIDAADDFEINVRTAIRHASP